MGVFYGVAFNGSALSPLWTAVGSSGEIQTSPDGINWTHRTPAGSYSGSFSGIAYNGSNLWTAVGDSGEIQTSPNGIAWTKQTQAGSYSGDFRGIVYNTSLGLLTVVGTTAGPGTSGEIQTSPNGIAWTKQSQATGPAESFYSV